MVKEIRPRGPHTHTAEAGCVQGTASRGDLLHERGECWLMTKKRKLVLHPVVNVTTGS